MSSQTSSSIDNESGFTPWCIGIVVKDKPFGTDIIAVWPSDKLTMASGNVFESQETKTVNYVSSDGSNQSQTTTSTDFEEATWFADSASHLWTSPMVRAGESVQLYKYKDTGKIYWKTLYREPALRKLERIIYGASNAPVGSNITVDLDSMYYIDYNTIDKVLTIKTTISDGEAFGYELSLSPRSNSAFLIDTVGNKFELNSDQNRLALSDIGGGLIETINGRVNILAPNSYNVTASESTFIGDTTFKDHVTINKTATVDQDTMVGGSITVTQGMKMLGSGGGIAEFGTTVRLLNNIIITGNADIYGFANLAGGYGPK